MIDLGEILLVAAFAMLVIVYVALPFLRKKPGNKVTLIEKWIQDERDCLKTKPLENLQVCPGCGEPFNVKDQFCSHCGRKRNGI